ncbi:MAG: response regulator [Planctomycetota bacterium]
MAPPMIVCVDDQTEVLNAVGKDLEELGEHLNICECDSAADARSVLDEAAEQAQPVAVILADCVMPEEDGVSLLTAIRDDARFPHTRCILLTGQASHGQTIEAINAAHIDRYLAKPWRPEELQQAVREQFTHWVLDSGADWQRYRSILDQDVLLKRLHG